MSASNQFQNPFNSSAFGQSGGFDGWSSVGSAPYGSTEQSYASLVRQMEAFEKENMNLRSQVKETNAKFTQIEKKFNDMASKLKTADDKFDDLSNNISQVRNKTLEPLAIFVGLFTFVSIGFQTFANVKDPILWPAILTIVLGGIVILAGLILHASSIARDARERRVYTGLIVLAGLFIGLTGVGVYAFAAGSVKTPYNRDCVTALSGKYSVADTKEMCQEN